MIRGFYTARSGLMAHQEHMNTISNNMANANTVGFKPMRTAFKDLMYQNLNRAEVENTAMVGHGVKINKNDLNMTNGALDATDYPLDFAIIDEGGFFAVQNAAGDIRYTRAGDFRLSNEDDTYYLVTGSYERVLDADGGEIEVEFDEETGEMTFDESLIGVYRFPNPHGLEAAGGSAFVSTEMSGEAEVIEDPTIKAGFLERSSVDVSREMVSVIEASKAFSFSARMVQVADEVEQTVNALR